MKWLRFFRGKRGKDVDTRIYSVKSPREVKLPPPPARRASVIRNVPEPDHPLFQDTDELELEAYSDDDGNPYETSSWQRDPEKGLRRLEDSKAIDRGPRPQSGSNNPYDTGSYKKKHW